MMGKLKPETPIFDGVFIHGFPVQIFPSQNQSIDGKIW